MSRRVPRRVPHRVLGRRPDLITAIEADAASDGEDTIVAINLSRALPAPPDGCQARVDERLASSTVSE